MNTTDTNERHLFGGNDFDFFSRDNFEKYKEAGRVLTLAQDINNVYIWILFTVGVPGNILTIITILSLQTICPVTFFIVLLAALDGSSLIAKFTAHQVVRNNYYIGTFGCKIEFLIIYVATFANWVLIFICAERFFTICYLSAKAVIFKMRNCYIAVAILSAILFSIFAGIFIPMRGAFSSGWMCGTYTEYHWFWINVWYWINATLYLFLPCLCIIPLTVLMVRKLYIANRNETGHHEKHKESETEAHQGQGVTEAELADNKSGFTLMIILAALFFVLLCLPACVFHLSSPKSNDILDEAQWELFGQIQHLLADSTHAINFFLYFVSVARFRNQVCKLVLCHRCRRTSFSPEQRIA